MIGQNSALESRSKVERKISVSDFFFSRRAIKIEKLEEICKADLLLLAYF